MVRRISERKIAAVGLKGQVVAGWLGGCWLSSGFSCHCTDWWRGYSEPPRQPARQATAQQTCCNCLGQTNCWKSGSSTKDRGVKQ